MNRQKIDTNTPDKPKQKQIGKTKGDLKRRARGIAKAIISGSSETDALKSVGYSHSSALNHKNEICNNPVIKQTFTEIMDKAGLTDESLCCDIDRLRKFNKKQVIRGKEADTIVEIEDGQVQLGAVKLAVQLKGHLIEKTQETGELTIKVVKFSE